MKSRISVRAPATADRFRSFPRAVHMEIRDYTSNTRGEKKTKKTKSLFVRVHVYKYKVLSVVVCRIVHGRSSLKNSTTLLMMRICDTYRHISDEFQDLICYIRAASYYVTIREEGSHGPCYENRDISVQ